MNAADAFNLSTWALRQIVKAIDEYDADADGDAGDALEDIRAICEDTQTHLTDAGYLEVPAMREP